MNNLKYDFTKYKENHVVINASAGTGKTFTIENMIPQFIEGGVSIENIAVLTFTEKAAAELQDRIRKQLYTQMKNAPEESRNKLEETIELLPNANIGTIHHFCRMLLKKYSLELGFSAKFGEIRDARDEIEIYFKKFWGKIEKNDSTELIELLQKIEFSRFKEILIELTEKSGGNKIKLLEKENPEKIQKYFSNLKSLLVNCDLTQDKNYVIKLNEFNTKTFSDNQQILNGIQGAFLTGESKPNQNVQKFILTNNSISQKEYETLLELLIAELNKAVAFKILNPIFEYANILIEEYDKYLLSQDMITLDGLILQTRRLVTNKKIREQIQKQIRYIILDECQDTNPIQINLVTELFDGLNWGIIFVGDPKQSIYRFRNADLKSYKTAVDSLISKVELSLDTSYRSSFKLMRAFNFIFPKFTSLTEIYKEVNANRALDDIAENIAPPLLLLGLDQNNNPQKKDESGQPFSAESLRTSAIEEIVNLIKTITNNPKYLIGDKQQETGYRKIKFSDIAILSNSNSSLNKLLGEFSKKSISANIYKSTTFYSHTIVQAISHLLHAIENPNDSSSLYKTLASDLFLIPEVILYELSESRGLSYLSDSKFPEINIIFESLRKAHENRYTKDVAYTMFEVLKDNQILEVISIGFEGKRNLANLYHLAEILSYNQLSENLSFGEVVRNFKKDVANSVEQEIKLDNDKKDDSFNSVQLMTIHASKGLEFPVCILYDIAAKPRPDSTSLFIGDPFLIENPMNIELKLHLSGNEEITTPGFSNKSNENKNELLIEKGRLLYVALTRAKDYLVLPLHDFDKPIAESLRSLIHPAFAPENIEYLIKEKLAENFQGQTNFTNPILEKSNESIFEEEKKVYISTLTSKDFYSHSGIRIQSYSSISKHAEMEEEFVKEKVIIEKNATPEGELTSPVRFTNAEKSGTSFGLLCHKVLEDFNLKLLTNEKSLLKHIEELVKNEYPRHGLSEAINYTSQDAIDFCYSTLTKSYPMNEAKTEFAKIKDWKYLTREKSFFYKLKSPKMDFLIGIGDGMFVWNNKYYLLDWKTNLIKPTENETIDDIIQNKTKDSYFYQYMIYSMNLLDSITKKGEDKRLVWETKFGGMLFVYMRIKEDNQGSFLIKPSYESILEFKSRLEN